MSLSHGFLLYQQNRPELAEVEFRKALAEDPEDGELHAWLSATLNALDRDAEAKEEAERAVGLQPDNEFCHFVLAQSLVSLEEMQQAETAIAEAIRLDPEDADYHGLLAHIYSARRWWEKALAAAEQGLALDPDHVLCTNVRVMALMHLDREEEAGQTVRRALAKDPENATTHANQGWRLLHQGQPAQALTHFEEALRKEPNSEWARKGLVESLKARYWIYGKMLRFMLWLGSMSRGRQWAFLIGLIVMVQVIGEIGARYPRFSPYATLLFVGYMSFVLLNWMSSAFFNLLLRLHPVGKHALSLEERRASLWVMGALVWIALFAGALLWFEFALSVWVMIRLCLILIPASAVYKCKPGPARFIMGAVAVVLALTYPCGILLALWGHPESLQSSHNLYLWGCVLSSWGINILNSKF